MAIEKEEIAYSDLFTPEDLEALRLTGTWTVNDAPSPTRFAIALNSQAGATAGSNVCKALVYAFDCEEALKAVARRGAFMVGALPAGFPLAEDRIADLPPRHGKGEALAQRADYADGFVFENVYIIGIASEDQTGLILLEKRSCSLSPSRRRRSAGLMWPAAQPTPKPRRREHRAFPDLFGRKKGIP